MRVRDASHASLSSPLAPGTGERAGVRGSHRPSRCQTAWYQLGRVSLLQSLLSDSAAETETPSPRPSPPSGGEGDRRAGTRGGSFAVVSLGLDIRHARIAIARRRFG